VTGAGAPSGAVRAILGPTASGKSALALAIARDGRRRGIRHELVAIDAFTVYRGMDIGTAKPSSEVREEIPHHLVDLLDPSEELTVVHFRDLARTAIAEIQARGAVPLLVGGSGLYWRAVVDGLEFPPTDPQVRAGLEARFEGDAAAAHAVLSAQDPLAGQRISPTNLRRIVRALEVIEVTGRRFSTWDDAWSRHTSIYPDLDVVTLDPPTDVLREAIARRSEAMVSAGLLEEERALRLLPRSRTAAAAIGYAEASAVIDGTLAPEALAGAIADRTRRYARRQRAWFRADPRPVATDPAQALARWT